VTDRARAVEPIFGEGFAVGECGETPKASSETIGLEEGVNYVDSIGPIQCDAEYHHPKYQRHQYVERFGVPERGVLLGG